MGVGVQPVSSVPETLDSAPIFGENSEASHVDANEPLDESAQRE